MHVRLTLSLLSLIAITGLICVDPARALDGAAKIAVGDFHACVLTTRGRVKCWGYNNSGQLGDGSSNSSSLVVDVIGLASGVTEISTGRDHTCALTQVGGLKCWGYNESGQLGNGSVESSSSPIDVVGLSSGIRAVAAGGSHTCALTAGGGVKCWGNNDSSQLGDGTNTSSLTPVDVVGLGSGVLALSAAYYHTCAITEGGAVKCWGANSSGNLGNGTNDPSLIPVDVIGLNSGVQSISSDYYHSCAVTAGGGVKCWGYDSNGSLGDGNQTSSSTPVDVVGLGSGVISVAAAGYHTCAIVTGGGVKCWGYNTYGLVGDGTRLLRPTPVDVLNLNSGVSAIAGGENFTCAIASDLTVKCWGSNYNGELGRGATTSSPVAVSGLGVNLTAIATGGAHSCAITSTGGVQCWGGNNYGQIGDGNVALTYLIGDVSGLSSGVVRIAGGRYHSCAINSLGALSCWGHNDHGQLGDGSLLDRSTPVGVVGLGSGVLALSAGDAHTCAVTDTGGVKCWGYNDRGQLGDNSQVHNSIPVDVIGLSSGVQAVSVGRYHSCAVTSGGGVKCWGGNYAGQLGNSSTVDSLTPVDVTGLGAGVLQLVAGYTHTCAIVSGGGLKCWGSNTFGQLGDATTIDRSDPVDVYGLMSGVAAVAAGSDHTCVVMTGGDVKCWGSNSNGNLGGAEIAGSTIALDVAGVSSALSAISAREDHTCVLLSGGGEKCWGANNANQLGNRYTENTAGDVAAWTVSGTVRHLGNGIVGANVDGGRLGTDVTDVSGYYAFILMRGGAYSLTPFKYQYDLSPASASGTLLHNVTHDFSATPIQATYTISGRVTVSGLPLAGVTVTGAGMPQSQATDANGNYMFTGVPQGMNYSLTPTKSGYTFSPTVFQGVLNANAVVDFAAVLNVYRISGKVIVGEGGLYRMVAGGGSHTCAVSLRGAVTCWGSNEYGQLGNGTKNDSQLPVGVTGLDTGVIAVEAGGDNSCALLEGGGVKCWGSGLALGNGSWVDSAVPVDVSGLTSGVTEVSVGGGHACAVMASGGLRCWGDNSYGELGDGSTWFALLPIQVVTIGSNVLTVSAGVDHTCVVTSGGAVKCWGSNDEGQLGDGSTDDSPIPVAVPSLGTDVVKVAAGEKHSCAIKAIGSVVCWGGNEYGQLGDGSTVSSLSPVSAVGLSSEGSSISAGRYHTCVRLSGGAVRCWGHNQLGQLGVGPIDSSSVPLEVSGFVAGVHALSAGDEHTCALTAQAGVKCWGMNETGQIGNGFRGWSSLPLLINETSPAYTKIWANGYSSCGLTSVGSIKCWGWNFGSEVYKDFIPSDVSGLNSNISMLSVGYYHTCAVTNGGGVKCWGQNGSGEFGDGSKNNNSVPVDAMGLSSGAIAVATGFSHTCILTTGGGVKCSGENGSGQLGNGNTTDSVTPVDVNGLNTGIAAIAAAYQSNCVLTSGGGVKCWGGNGQGILGDGTTNSSSTPVDVTGLGSGITEIATGNYHACALSTGGGVKCWGANGSGQLGNGTNTQSSLPVDVSGLSSGVVSISAGFGHSCALLTGGAVKCWGGNGSGQLGNGTVEDSAEPVAVSGLGSAAIAIAVGDYHTCALFASGSVKCWGKNNFGQLGNYDYSVPGYVTGALGGVPLAGVLLGGPGLVGTQFTDQNGDYVISGISHGTRYTLTPNIAGYKILPGSVSGTLFQSEIHDYFATPTAETYQLSGRVTFGGTPLAGVVVTSSLGQTVTDANGGYSFGAVLYGTSYEINASKIGYGFSPESASGTITGVTNVDFIASLIDSDHDGLSDLEEAERGTDPGDSDSDDDTVSDGQEIVDGTNPLDRGSMVSTRDNTLCTEWNGFLGMYNVLEHLNMGTQKLAIATRLNDIFGDERGNVGFQLKSGYQYDLLVHDMPGFDANTYGLVCPTATNGHRGDLDGRMVFYKSDSVSNGYQFAFAMPLGSALKGRQYVHYNTYQPSLDPEDADNLVANWIQVTNLETNRQSGELIFYERDGQEVARQTVVLKGGSRFDYSAHDLAGLRKVGLVEWIPKQTFARFQLRNVRYYYRSDRENFDGALQLEGMVGSGELLTVPLDGVGSSSVLELTNTRSEEVRVDLKIYATTGGVPISQNVLKLPGHGTYHFIADQILKGEKGIAEIRGNLPESVIATNMQYARSASLGIKNVYGIQARQALGTSLRGSYNTYLGQGCRLLMTNPTSSEVGTTVSMKRYDGTNIELVRLLAVPAHGLKDYDLCKQEEANVYGVVTLQLAVSNTIYAMVLRIGNNEDYRFPTPVRE